MATPIHQRLREDVLASVFAPDEPLTEAKLTERYGASRTPVREALQRLEQDGLLERRGKAVVVRTHSAEEIIDIYESRIILEQAAASKAATKATSLDKRSLNALLLKMRDLDVEDGRILADTNRTFHTQLWHATHSPSLISLLERLDQQVRRYSFTTLTYPGRWPTVLAAYTELLAAIEEGDAERAGNVAARHMTEALAIRLKMYAEDPRTL
ncbi:GntR family transcriptional regulator [Paenarthrobacter sp. 22069]|uniref:GntR family transcriptional regulator n=1 Tax=Paenarthrobacter sp. 22069 TaxID=3453864 RepID=UPI003F8636DC